MKLAARKPNGRPWGAWESKGVIAPNGMRAPESVHTVLLNREAGYLVQISTIDLTRGDVDHLWITRVDRSAIRSWTDLQRIKCEVLADGASRLAIEVFPESSEVVDQANMQHLWVMPVGYRLPFGLMPEQLK